MIEHILNPDSFLLLHIYQTVLGFGVYTAFVFANLWIKGEL